MKRDTFKKLQDEFTATSNPENRVQILISYELKTLTNSQIDKLLKGLNETETKQLIEAINEAIDKKMTS